MKHRVETVGAQLLGSPPARGRGLKHFRVGGEDDRARRPPRGGVD